VKRIPRQFKIGPHTIKVRIVTQKGMLAAYRARDGELPPDEDAPYGYTYFAGNTIYVQRVRKGFPKSLQMHTFWHEYFHMLFHHAGRHRLSLDETLVDSLGGLQLQAINSFQYN